MTRFQVTALAIGGRREEEVVEVVVAVAMPEGHREVVAVIRGHQQEMVAAVLIGDLEEIVAVSLLKGCQQQEGFHVKACWQLKELARKVPTAPEIK